MLGLLGNRQHPLAAPWQGWGLGSPFQYPMTGLGCRGGLGTEVGSYLAALMQSRGLWGRGQLLRLGPRVALRRSHSQGTGATTCTSGGALAA